MIYLSWVALYEGSSDAAYFNVLLPRVMEEITKQYGVQRVTVPPSPVFYPATGRGVAAVAREFCENASSFHLIFIHADTGGRALEQGAAARGTAYCRAFHDMCGWRQDRCVVVGPRRETEAWVLADGRAVLTALGITGDPDDRGLPAGAGAAEALADPKAVLNVALARISHRGRQHGTRALFTRVAQEQRLDLLRGSASYRGFEANLRRALASLGCL